MLHLEPKGGCDMYLKGKGRLTCKCEDDKWPHTFEKQITETWINWSRLYLKAKMKGKWKYKIVNEVKMHLKNTEHCMEKEMKFHTHIHIHMHTK